LLCRDEVALIEERTALINELQSALREYYPAALEAFIYGSNSCRAALYKSLREPSLA
jgi:hypothetical protein